MRLDGRSRHNMEEVAKYGKHVCASHLSLLLPADMYAVGCEIRGSKIAKGWVSCSERCLVPRMQLSAIPDTLVQSPA
jgi:hypothetical protein